MLSAQDTFSIVAADSVSRKVGSAGASCVNLFSAGITDPSFLGDLLPDTGAINTQASYHSINQDRARQRMRAGDNPEQITSWMINNDVGANPGIRQYGIVGFSGNQPLAAGFTGSNCINYKNHITGNIDGISYSIQGNILSGQHILDSMEVKFRRAQGDLACRLMAALQGANVVGADTRCASNNSSSLFAFVKVANPDDPYGIPSFSVSVRTATGARIEPVDTLQKLFDAQNTCLTTQLFNSDIDTEFAIYPNPSSGPFHISCNNQDCSFLKIKIYNSLGRLVHTTYAESKSSKIDLGNHGKGMYYYRIYSKSHKINFGKIIIQ
jgi:uncharacterized Ntn-hydrolase superfamily protein